ncbi:MAG: hypothetical protein K2N87_12385 [Eubacterium sp.]|nr:hypothetical protein [Eubacterium sp.]
MYGDEGWISLLQDRMEKARNRKIQKGSVLVGGEELVFAEREIIKDRLWMWLPNTFALLAEEAVKCKYPDANRPQQVYTDQETDVNICFTLLEGEIEKDGETAFEYCDDIVQYVQQYKPECSILKQAVVKAKEKKVPWLAFVSQAEDTQMYNLMFFTVLDLKKDADSDRDRIGAGRADTAGNLLLGTCNCLAQDEDVWKGIFVQMLVSMRIK